MQSPVAPAQRGTSMPWLPSLLLTTFVIGTDDFVIAGILPEIAANFAVGEAAAGQLVTVFSLVYAAAAPVMAVATARLSRRRLVVGGLAVFALINLATVFAPTFATLMMLRVAAALMAATISPAAFAIAGALAPEERTGRAIAAVAAGLTVSLVAGVPLGSWISGIFGWQAAFLLVTTLTALALTVTALSLPHLPKVPARRVTERLTVLRTPAVLSGLIGTVVGATSGLMPYVFIAPVVMDISSADRSLVPVAIGLYGVAGAAGTVIGGLVNDRWGTDRSIISLLVMVVGSTVAMTVAGLAFEAVVPFWLLASLIVIWGVAGWAYNPPMNARTLHLAGPAATEAVALNTSGLYVGIATAGVIGGGAAGAAGGMGVLIAASAIGLVGLTFMAIAVRRYPGPRPDGNLDVRRVRGVVRSSLQALFTIVRRG